MSRWHVKRDPRTGLFLRPGTCDDLIAREQKQYLALDPRPGDTLLDIGANIGAVAALFADLAVTVHAFEPEPSNFRLLKRNAGDRAALYQAAVVGDAVVGERRDLFVNEGKNKGLHSLIATRGRSVRRVDVISFQNAVTIAEPTLVKIDIEGGEYDLPLGQLPATVRGIAVELHLTRRAWRAVFAPAVVAAIETQGFVAVRPPRIGPKNWATLGVWLRKESE